MRKDRLPGRQTYVCTFIIRIFKSEGGKRKSAFYLFRQTVERIGFAPKLNLGCVSSWKKPKMLVSSEIPPAGILQGRLEIN